MRSHRFPWSRLGLLDGTTIDARRWYPLSEVRLGQILEAMRLKFVRSDGDWRATIVLPRPRDEDVVAHLWVWPDGRRGVEFMMRLDSVGLIDRRDDPGGTPVELGAAWEPYPKEPEFLVRDANTPGAPMAAPDEIAGYLGRIGDIGVARIRLVPPPALGEDGFGVMVTGCVAWAGMAALAALGGVVSLLLLASQGVLTGSLLDWLLWLVIASAVTAIGWSIVVLGATRVLPPTREAVTILVPVPAIVHDAAWLGTVGLVFVIAPLAIGALAVGALSASPAAAWPIVVALVLAAGAIATGAAIYVRLKGW